MSLPQRLTLSASDDTQIDGADTVVTLAPRRTVELVQTYLPWLMPLLRAVASTLGTIACAYAGMALVSLAVSTLGGVGLLFSLLGMCAGAGALLGLALQVQHVQARHRARLGSMPPGLVTAPEFANLSPAHGGADVLIGDEEKTVRMAMPPH